MFDGAVQQVDWLQTVICIAELLTYINTSKTGTTHGDIDRPTQYSRPQINLSMYSGFHKIIR